MEVNGVFASEMNMRKSRVLKKLCAGDVVSCYRLNPGSHNTAEIAAGIMVTHMDDAKNVVSMTGFYYDCEER